MTQTLTIRLGGPALRRLRARARALGVSPSELVRAVLEREVGAAEGEPTALELTQRWVGAVSSSAVAAGRDARAELDGWHPDRRG
ncbi:MAG: ribbon-helix-helix protein, CopG family [Polyangiaceae bacterium]|nr:ribbon-helix-helix protein, CopG family [Polyangiaceae bacterium]